MKRVDNKLACLILCYQLLYIPYMNSI